jgi:1-pyrroline-5-carboxylate dehydrogenase
MGGKNAAVVGASADLEAAAEGIAKAAFGFSGQKCSACARAIVVDEVHDELRDRLSAIATTYRVGDPADPDAATGRS